MFKLIVILSVTLVLTTVCQDAEDDSYPYILEINTQLPWSNEKIKVCTAILIHPTWAITTALCVFSVSLDLLSVSNNDSSVIPLSKVLIHPDYDMRDDAYVALLQLSSPCDSCSPLPLTTSTTAPEGGSLARAVSWSNNNVTYSYMEVMAVDVTVMSLEGCNEDYEGFLNKSLTDNSFCGENYFSDTSPVVYMQTGGAVLQDGGLVGMIVEDRGMFMPDLPSIYTNVAYFVDWINENLPQ